MTFSPQQDQAMKMVNSWLKDKKRNPIFRLFGYAGTGKTTIARELAEQTSGRILYAAFTGKAALQLRKKGCTGASTLHSLIYKPVFNERTKEYDFILNPDSPLNGAKLLVIDEVSMVGEDLARDILSFNVPILVLGDPAQLPPVKGEGYFINAKPDMMLTEVHRQAQDNPIIRMSMDIREGNGMEFGEFVKRRSEIDREALKDMVINADQVLCGLNKTRVSFNARIREIKGYDPDNPVKGDKLICLRNNREKNIFNGGMWECIKSSKLFQNYEILAKSLDEDRPLVPMSTHPYFFSGRENELEWYEKKDSDQLTYGWAITCHKSQGSQWDDVLIFDESGTFRESQKNWLYTAVTRAAERVMVVR
jgi:exodeoxyribonuclease-5